ncbi:MAG: aminotransferase class I/II-fold pyridoxal phosphate-dependent enzyme [Pseudomonadota bacterium]
MERSTRSAVDAFIVMDVLAAANRAEAEGRRIIRMEVGQPGTPAPEGARRALAEALERGTLGYTEALGLPALRQRIARHYRDWYGCDIDPARVVVTAGASGAFLLAFTALFDAGDKVAMGDPGYPSYRQILRALSVEPVGLRTEAADRFQLTADQVRQSEGLKGVILASPGNPSGTMLGRQPLANLIEAARERGLAVISDEIYHGIAYGDRSVSALEISDDVYVVNSFSKYFSMTGWRIGWMVVPEDHVRTVERLAQNMFICAPHASQVAALAAMDCTKELERHVAQYRANRNLLLTGLPEAGFRRFAPPDGAFYIYADLDGITDDALGFCRDVLAGAGVAVTPGLDFDPARGHGTLRFSYARPTEDIAEGLGRLKDFMEARA